MGQRGGGAAFMPSKVVFPGGALDPEDRSLAEQILSGAASDDLDPRLWREAQGDLETGAPAADAPDGPVLGLSLALSAIRETFEETGLRLGRAALSPEEMRSADAARELGGDWAAFSVAGDAASAPKPEALGYFFRAITPPTKSRRFDARFFVAFAGDLMGDVDDFSGASGELGGLAWIPLSRAADYDLPFITQIVIAELQAVAALCAETAASNDPDQGLSHMASAMRRRPVPFFRHRKDPSQTSLRPVFEAV